MFLMFSAIRVHGSEFEPFSESINPPTNNQNLSVDQSQSTHKYPDRVIVAGKVTKENQINHQQPAIEPCQPRTTSTVSL
jgi:hypothetical protein